MRDNFDYARIGLAQHLSGCSQSLLPACAEEAIRH
jgi:hypothetical protein